MNLKLLIEGISAIAALVISMAMLRIVVTRPILLPLVGVWILVYAYVLFKFHKYGMDAEFGKPSLPSMSLPIGRQKCGCFYFKESKDVLVEESTTVHEKKEYESSVEITEGTGDKYRCTDCGDVYYKNIEWDNSEVLFWDELDVDDMVDLNEIN